MDDFERKIAQALRADEAAEYQRLDPDLPPWEMVFETFKGRNRWLNIVTAVWAFVFFVAAVFCFVRFFGADEVRAALAWGLGGVLLMLAVSFLKMWWWMEMQKNSIIREVKRVELQLASLARSLSRGDG